MDPDGQAVLVQLLALGSASSAELKGDRFQSPPTLEATGSSSKTGEWTLLLSCDWKGTVPPLSVFGHVTGGVWTDAHVGDDDQVYPKRAAAQSSLP